MEEDFGKETGGWRGKGARGETIIKKSVGDGGKHIEILKMTAGD